MTIMNEELDPEEEHKLRTLKRIKFELLCSDKKLQMIIERSHRLEKRKNLQSKEDKISSLSAKNQEDIQPINNFNFFISSISNFLFYFLKKLLRHAGDQR